MTTITDTRAPAPVVTGRTHRVRQAMGWTLLGLALVILASYLADAPGITASATWGSALRLTIPIMLAALGGLYSERVGVINVGLEGMMIGGTWVGGLFGWWGGPWAALVGGVIGGLLLGAIMAVLTIELGLNQLVIGIAINVLAAGIARFLSDIVFSEVDGGSVARSPRFDGTLPTVGIPFLSGGFGTSDLLGTLEDGGVPVVSQLAGMLGGLTRDVSLAVVIGLLVIPLTLWLGWRTPFGLRWRSAGEQPEALQALGGSVQRTRYAGVLFGSALAGFGGGYLVLISQGYVENQVSGRGFIGLATLIFGNWMPGGVLAGAGLFGFSDAVGLGRPETFRALVFVLAGVFLVLGAMRFASARRRAGIAPFVLGAVLLVVFFFVPLPARLATAAPYLVTLAVLVVVGRAMKPPAALGRFLPRRNGR